MKKYTKIVIRIMIYLIILIGLMFVSYRIIDPVLFTSIRTGSNFIPKFYIYLGKDPDLRSSKGASLLSQSCFSNNIEMVGFLIDRGAGIDSLVAEGITPISVAAQMKNYEIVKLLTEKGANLNKRLEDNKTCLLSIVVANGDLEMVKYLVENGANVNQYNKKCFTPVSVASYNNKTEILDYLFANGGRKRDIKRKAPPLVKAASEGNDKLVRKLLEDGTDVNTSTSNGQTALFLAVWNKKEDVLETLIASGADVNRQDQDGLSALMKACEEADMNIVKLLVESGADLNLRSKFGKTALMCAVQKKKNDVVKYLLERGADTKIITRSGRSAFSYAKQDSTGFRDQLRDRNDVISFDDNVLMNDIEDIKSEWLYPYPNGSDLYTVCAIPGTDKIVAGGRDCTFLTYDLSKETLEVNQDVFGIDESVKDICFVDKYKGYALVSSGKLLRTDDGGRTWNLGAVNVNGNISKMYFNGRQGFLVGSNDVIIRLDSATGKWTLCNEKLSLKYDWKNSLNDIYVDNSGFGLAVGYKGVVLETEDYGRTWKVFGRIKTDMDLIDIAFADEKKGYILCQKDAKFITKDGGKTWKSDFNEADRFKATYSEKTFNYIFFKDNKTGYLNSYPGGILKTEDKGQTWSSAGVEKLSDRSIFVKNRIYSTERHNIVVSSDEGKSWNSVNSKVRDGQIKVHYSEGRKIIATVDNTFMLISTNSGSSWDKHETDKFLSVYFTSPENGFMIYSNNLDKYSGHDRGYYGSSDKIRLHLGLKKSEDGGKSWKEVESNLNEIVENEIVYGLTNRWQQSENLYFFDDLTGFIFCRGAILRTTDGGSNWKLDDSNTLWKNLTNSEKVMNTTSMFFVNSAKGFNTDQNGGIYKTVNGGKDWKLVFKSDKVFNSYDKIRFNSIVFTDAETGFAVGDFESICKTDDGGDNWKLISNTVYSNDYKKVYFHDELNGVIAGDYLYITQDGGRNWDHFWGYSLGMFDVSSLYYNGRDEVVIAGKRENIRKIS